LFVLTKRLARWIGIARAKELIWTGQRIQGEEAFEYGLVQKVAQTGQALGQAMELAWKIAGNGPVAIRASKEAIDGGMMASDMKEVRCASWRTLEQQGREDNEGKGQRLAVDVKSDLC
jgi:enoyl-CoA hydratase/carnithine racemase